MEVAVLKKTLLFFSMIFLCGLLFVSLIPQNANATWHTILYENFGGQWGTWPWQIAGNQWNVLPVG